MYQVTNPLRLCLRKDELSQKGGEAANVSMSNKSMSNKSMSNKSMKY